MQVTWWPKLFKLSLRVQDKQTFIRKWRFNLKHLFLIIACLCLLVCSPVWAHSLRENCVRWPRNGGQNFKEKTVSRCCNYGWYSPSVEPTKSLKLSKHGCTLRGQVIGIHKCKYRPQINLLWFFDSLFVCKQQLVVTLKAHLVLMTEPLV